MSCQDVLDVFSTTYLQSNKPLHADSHNQNSKRKKSRKKARKVNQLLEKHSTYSYIRVRLMHLLKMWLW